MDLEARVVALESKLHEVEALANLALRLLAVEKPVAMLLRRFGANESEETAVHALLDNVAARAEKGGMYAPSFNGFASDLFAKFPAVRNNLEFVELLLDTMKLDRPTYQRLHAYAVANEWPRWS
jgi:hypothetical protein